MGATLPQGLRLKSVMRLHDDSFSMPSNVRRTSGAKKLEGKRSDVVEQVIAAFPAPHRKPKRPRLDDRKAVSSFIRTKVSARQG